jgi:muconolactone delta-isomerase
MKLLALEKEAPGVSASAFTGELLRREAAAVWRLHQRGVVREIYFRADREEAVLVLECSSLQEAETVLSTLPLVERSLIAFEIVPLKAYPGFERLFTPPL